MRLHPARLAVALVVAAPLAGTPLVTAATASELSWDAACGEIRDGIEGAFAAAPDMALGNRTKIERLLRDARVTDDREVCIGKLKRAYRLLAQAYADAGQSLDLLPAAEAGLVTDG